MRRKLNPLSVAPLMVAAFLLASTTMANAADAEFKGKVVSVPDGDTLNIEHDGHVERVILYGADCPEMSQPAGIAARKFTDEAAWHKMVVVAPKGRDDKGRTIGVVFLPDGTNLNTELIRQGLAWWSDKYAPGEAEMKQLHLAAQSQHRGLWADPNPVAPWIWRNGQRKVEAKVMPSQ